MHSVLFRIGGVSIYGYGTMMALGMILCVAFCCYRAKNKFNIDPDMMFNVAFIGILFGIVGAKLTYWLVHIKEVIADPSMLTDLSGGFTVYGGLALGVIAAVVYLKYIKKTTVLDKLDLAAPSIAMAQGFGRIGCFLAGCCYGKAAPAGAWYAVTFPEGCLAPAGVPLYPTQLISAGLDILLFLFLWFWSNRESFRGELIAFYMILYSIGRFFVEMLRDDPRGEVGVLATSQFLAIIILAFGIILWCIFRKLNLKSLAELAEGETDAETEDPAEAEEPEEAEAQETAEEKEEQENGDEPAPEQKESDDTAVGEPSEEV